jgi:hypothetical protein
MAYFILCRSVYLKGLRECTNSSATFQRFEHMNSIIKSRSANSVRHSRRSFEQFKNEGCTTRSWAHTNVNRKPSAVKFKEIQACTNNMSVCCTCYLICNDIALVKSDLMERRSFAASSQFVFRHCRQRITSTTSR